MSETWTPPAPPDQTAWWDVTATADAVLVKLRLTSTDVDRGRIEALIPVAGYRMNQRLDRTEVQSAAQIAANKQALIIYVIALYGPPARKPDGSFVDPLDTIPLAGRQRRGIA